MQRGSTLGFNCGEPTLQENAPETPLLSSFPLVPTALLSRKEHPDVSKLPDAKQRWQEEVPRGLRHLKSQTHEP